MSREEEYKALRERMKAYQDGTLISKQYTNDEILEKRMYFESCVPDAKFKITKHGWIGEIKRQFDLSENIKKYPDYVFTKLEFILKFGL